MNPDVVKVGCLSWTYPDWAGSFYPDGTKPADYLQFYSSIFDIVEVDSTFYRTPNVQTIKQWKEKVPERFTFAVKLPKKITHSVKGAETAKEYGFFQRVIGNLGDHLGCVVAQMPPYFKFETGVERLKQIISDTDHGIRLAVELRHKSWYNAETYALLRKHGVCLVWAVNEYVEDELQPIATTDFVYLRFRGEFNEFSKFDRLQSDKSGVLGSWWKNLEKVIESGKIAKAYVLVSNHFEGFAPSTANRFLEIAHMKKADWSEKKGKSDDQLHGFEAQ
jgi:uncharacterized protein YecE (DUF72 family)